MNKNELVSAVAESCGVTKKDVDKVVKAVIAEIGTELKAGGRVQLPELGTIKCAERAERTVRNPRTGEKIVSPACKVVKFTPAKSLKELVNE